MTFLAPWAAWFFAGIPVIAMLYLLKVRRRRRVMPSLFLWTRVLEETRRRSLFQKFRQWISLLINLLIYLLLLLALARPESVSVSATGTSTVLVLDTRLSMQAASPGEKTRFNQALETASTLVRAAGNRQSFAVLATHGRGAVMMPFSSDETGLRSALGKMQPTDAGGRLQDVMQIASAIVEAMPGTKRILVLTGPPTDETAQILSGSKNSSVPVEILHHGSSLANTGITRLGIRRLPSSPLTNEIQLEVAHHGPSPVSKTVELILDGELLDVKTVELNPGESRTEFYTVTDKGDGDGQLVARFASGDALPGDDVAYAVVAPAPVRRVLLVSTGNRFLESMLHADEMLRFELLAPDVFRSSMAGGFDAVILDNTLPPDFTEETPGNFFFFGRSPLESGGDPLPVPPLVDAVEEGHPALGTGRLDGMTIFQARPLTVPAESAWRWTVLVESLETALLVAGEHADSDGGPRRRMVSAFGVNDTDLPLRVAFPLFLTNAIQWLCGADGEIETAAAAGDAFPPGTTVQAPAEIAESADSFFARNGFYQINNGEQSAWVAVNTLDPAQSNLNAQDDSIPEGRAHRRSSAWPPWMLCALAAFFLCSAEWWWFHRRATE